MSKKNLAFEERVYLDNISEKCGLGVEEAKNLEINIRKEMKLSPPGFIEEYSGGLTILSKSRRIKDEHPFKKLDSTYVSKGRISAKAAQSLKKKISEKALESDEPSDPVSSF